MGRGGTRPYHVAVAGNIWDDVEVVPTKKKEPLRRAAPVET